MAEAAVADQVDQHVLAEGLSKPHGERYRSDTRFGVIGVDVDDRHVKALGEVTRVARRARIGRIGREADLVVGDDVEHAASRVPLQGLEIQGLGVDTLSGEGRVAMDEDGNRDGRVVQRLSTLVDRLTRPRAALDDGVDLLEVARVRGERDGDRASRAADVGSLGAEVVLHVARGRRRDETVLIVFAADFHVAFELCEDRFDRLPDNVRDDVQAAAVGHPDHDLGRSTVSALVDDLVQHRDQRVDALDREGLLTEIGAAKEAVEGIDVNQLVEQLLAALGSHRTSVPSGLDFLAQPVPLVAVGDVLDLVGDRAAVGRAKLREDIGEGLALQKDRQHSGGHPGHHCRCQAEELGVERGPALGLRAERVELGGKVSMGAVVTDLGHREGDRVKQLVIGDTRGRDGGGREHRECRLGAGCARGGRHHDAEARGDGAVEVTVTLQEHLDLAQEGAALGPLDDPVVVGARDRHHLADAEVCNRCRVDMLEARRQRDRARCDDRSLADHQARHRGDRPEAARVCEAHRRALELVRGDLADPRPRDQILECGVKAREPKGFGALDDRHEERTAAVLAFDIDGDPEVDPGRDDLVRPLGDTLEGRAHDGERLDGLDDRPRDEVGVGELLASASSGEGGVERAPALVEHADVHRPECRRGGDLAALIHVRGECGGGPLEEHRALGRRSAADRWATV